MEIVSIIGPIGSGKSTFVQNIKPYEVFDHYYHEDVKGNKYLSAEQTIENQIKCQEYIINHKQNFYSNLDFDSDIKVLEDASLYQDLFYVYSNFYQQQPEVFEQITNKYLELINNYYAKANKHTIIFIDLSANQNLANVKKRGRDFEQELDVDFFNNQKQILQEILDRFDDKIELKIYQPQAHMFTCSKEELVKNYQQIYKDLGLI